MNSTNKEKLLFRYLLNRSIDGQITDEEVRQFNHLMSTFTDLEDYYVECLQLNFALREIRAANEFSLLEDPVLKEQFWADLAEYEKQAPTIEIVQEPTQQELIQKVERKKVNYKLSKSSLFSLIVSAAAILLIVLFVKLAPVSTSIEVATLVDQINVKWGEPGIALDNGDRLWTKDKPLDLRKGIVKIQYDNGVEVLVEAPAIFEIDRSKVYLEYGRLYSHVSDAGLGFTVETPTSQFVDHGTKFGVQADINGSSELHVIKGRVQLFAGPKGGSRVGQMVTENKAVRYDAYNDQTAIIPIKKKAFVRQINSGSKTVWRGQDQLDLADIVGGGNGLGTGLQGSFIQTATGEWFAQNPIGSAADTEMDRKNATGYHTVSDNSFIDGVFIPDATQTASQIDSTGCIFEDMPDTFGGGYGGVYHVRKVLNKSVELGNIEYGIPGRNALFMHANAGITFDLSQVRRTYPWISITAFQADCGIGKPAFSSEIGAYADFWVIVDGQVRFVQKGVKGSQVESINVSLSATDRFLTLMTTDGGPGSPSLNGRTGFNDWCVFGVPVLVLE